MTQMLPHFAAGTAELATDVPLGAKPLASLLQEHSPPATLRMAVAPLRNWFPPGVMDKLLVATETGYTKGGLLTAEQSKAVYLYTLESDFYKEVNRVLRETYMTRTKVADVLLFLRLLASALERAPRYEGMMYRAIEDLGEGSVFEYYKKKVGSAVTWYQVNSCTKNMCRLDQFLKPVKEKSRRFVVFAINGAVGADVSSYSAVRGEDEVMLFACCTLQVLGYSEELQVVQLGGMCSPHKEYYDLHGLVGSVSSMGAARTELAKNRLQLDELEARLVAKEFGLSQQDDIVAELSDVQEHATAMKNLVLSKVDVRHLRLQFSADEHKELLRLCRGIRQVVSSCPPHQRTDDLPPLPSPSSSGEYRIDAVHPSSFEKMWSCADGCAVTVWRAGLQLPMGRGRNAVLLRFGDYMRPTVANPEAGDTCADPATGREVPLACKLWQVTDDSASKIFGSTSLAEWVDKHFPYPVGYTVACEAGVASPVYFWEPVPPDARFVGAGMVVTTTPDPPSMSAVRCVPAAWCRGDPKRNGASEIPIWEESRTFTVDPALGLVHVDQRAYPATTKLYFKR